MRAKSPAEANFSLNQALLLCFHEQHHAIIVHVKVTPLPAIPASALRKCSKHTESRKRLAIAQKIFSLYYVVEAIVKKNKAQLQRLDIVK